MTNLDYLNLHNLLIKLKADCENSGVCCNCDNVSLCPFAFTGTDGGPDGEPWAYLDAVDKSSVIEVAAQAANEVMPWNE